MNTLFSDKISQHSQSTLFGDNASKKPNEERKTSITSSLFNNEKNSIFGAMFQNNGNDEQKNEKENENQKSLFVSNTESNVFGFNNKNDNNKDSENKSKESQGGLFKFGLFQSPNEKNKNENKEEKNIFKSPTEKKGITKNLFQTSDKENDLSSNKIAKENKEKKNEQEDNNLKKENIFNLSKKEESKTNSNKLFSISTSFQSKPNPQSSNNNSHSTTISKNNDISTNITSNNQISSKRIEDDKLVQSALQNLYVYDILTPSPLNNNPPLLSRTAINIQHKAHISKKCKTIDFKFYVQIKDIPNAHDEGCNMVCRTNQKMSVLMKQAQLYVKRKYKLTKELNDFKIVLMKNFLQLPINDDECIGDYIKNNDKIMIYLVHNSFEQNEEEQKFYIKNNNEIQEKEDEKINQEQNSDNEEEINNKFKEKEKIQLYFSQNMKKINNIENFKNENEEEEDFLCPTDKLPILKRQGYSMNPDEYTISRMTLKEIKNVSNFSISNENGKIEFEGKVSLYGANLDKLFNIEHEYIEYEKGEWCHSPRGQNFNIPAVITFYNIESNIDISNINEKKIFIDNLKKKCKKFLNGEFISYDFEVGTLIYKIPYFY